MPGWQFYHPTLRRVLPSQDVTFDESVPFYRLFPYRSAPPPPPLLFLAPGPPPVDPLPPQGRAPSSVSQVDPLPGTAPVEVAVCAAQVAASGGAASGGAEPGGAGSEGAGSGGAEPGGDEPGGAEPWGVVPRGAESEGAESGGTEPQGAASSGGPAAPGDGGAGDAGAGGAGVTAGAGGLEGTTAAGSGGARTRGTGAAGTGGAGGAGAGDPTEPGTARAGGSCAGGAGVGGAGPGGAGVGGTGAGGTGAAGAGAVDPGAGGARGTVQQRPYYVPLLQQILGVPSSTGLTPPLLYLPRDQPQPPLQPASPLPAPSPYTQRSGGLTKRREPASRLVSPVRTARRAPRSRPPPVPGTHAMALRPSSVPLRVPLPAPPESSLSEVPDPESDRACAASPTISRLLATAVTDSSFESAATSALVAELLDFGAACRLDYATALVAESESASPQSVGGECALGTDVLEDRQEDIECLEAAVPRFASLLLAPEGDPDAPDIPTPHSYAEAIRGPYSSQWQAAMDAEMAFWKSTGTYVDEVPPPGANIVDGMRACESLSRVLRLGDARGGSDCHVQSEELEDCDGGRAFGFLRGVGLSSRGRGGTPGCSSAGSRSSAAAASSSSGEAKLRLTCKAKSALTGAALMVGDDEESDYEECAFAFFSPVEMPGKPSTLKESLESSDAEERKNTMESELKSIEENGTWELVELPARRMAITSKWLFKIKFDADGKNERYKSRLVAKGYQQKEKVDYKELFAPVVKPTTLRTLFAGAAIKGWVVKQMDVTTAFLNGILEEEIFMAQPEGFDNSSGRVWKLKKALYGRSEEAPRHWYLKLREVLEEIGFTPSSADHSLFMLGEGEQRSFMVVYVDDILIFSPSSDLVKEVMLKLQNKFKCKALGDVSFYLGLHIERDVKKRCMRVHQRKYQEALAANFGQSEGHVATPFPSGFNCVKGPKEESVGEEERRCFHSLVGSLMYAAVNIRPDVAVGGFICCVGGGPTSWESKKQVDQALSSVESEYSALFRAVREIVWQRHLLAELGEDRQGPTPLYCDSQGAISLGKNPVLHGLTKHMRVKWHWTRSMVAAGEVELHYVKTTRQPADMMTKRLVEQQHWKCCKLVGMTLN
ncbi:unnamed protein product [Closterium sp. NIES-53]